MEMTPFHAYCHARTLENLSDEEKLLPDTIPYAVAAPGQESAFSENGIVICTYDFAASHEKEASALSWDMTVFDEATAIQNRFLQRLLRLCRCRRFSKGRRNSDFHRPRRKGL